MGLPSPCSVTVFYLAPTKSKGKKNLFLPKGSFFLVRFFCACSERRTNNRTKEKQEMRREKERVKSFGIPCEILLSSNRDEKANNAVPFSRFDRVARQTRIVFLSKGPGNQGASSAYLSIAEVLALSIDKRERIFSGRRKKIFILYIYIVQRERDRKQVHRQGTSSAGKDTRGSARQCTRILARGDVTELERLVILR